MTKHSSVAKTNKLLHKRIVQRFGTAAAAFVVVGSVASYGIYANHQSHAAGLGVLSLGLTANSSANVTTGGAVSVNVIENSGTDLVNSVQTSINYDATRLHFEGVTEGTAFPTVAATSTGTAGLIRLGRGTASGTTVSGTNTVATLRFTATTTTGTAALSYDPAYSFIVRSTDNTNILSAQTGLSLTVKLPAPSVTSVAPTSGSILGGDKVTVTGTNFSATSLPSVDGVATTLQYVSPTSVVVYMPAHAAGIVGMTITNPDGQSVTKASAYTYVTPTPTVTNVTPASGPIAGGTQVTVNGTNFISGKTTVLFDTTAAVVKFVSATQLIATAPAHSQGSVAVKVTNDNVSSSLAAAYSYVAPTVPAIKSIAPAGGTTAGGTQVTITGSNFVTGAKVAFGTAAATNVTFVNATTLQATTPAIPAGPVNVVITNPDGQIAISTNGFSYKNLGDANNDGRVNAIDLSILISNDGKNYAAADFNFDGTVGAADLAILLGRWTW